MYAINIILFIGGVLYTMYAVCTLLHVHWILHFNIEQLNTNQKLKYPPDPSSHPKKKTTTTTTTTTITTTTKGQNKKQTK